MKRAPNRRSSDKARIAVLMRRRIERSGERVWSVADFSVVPASIAAQVLSRLAHEGVVNEVGPGLYHLPVSGRSGTDHGRRSRRRACRFSGECVFPAGLTAARLLGFASQDSPRPELAVIGHYVPRHIAVNATVVHTGRPQEWHSLSQTDAAIFDLLRNRGVSSELSPEDTIAKLLAYCGEGKRFERLLGIARSEPPRVRAMLGAIGQELGKPATDLISLRASLNTASRFDFGRLVGLPFARQWRAKVDAHSNRQPHAVRRADS